MVVDFDNDTNFPDAAEPLHLLPGCLIDWDKLQRIPSDSAFAPAPELPWSMVAIRTDSKNPPIVFPPTNHENLIICTDPPPNFDHIPHIHTEKHGISFTDSYSESYSDSDSNSPSTSSPSESSPPTLSPIFPPPIKTPVPKSKPPQQFDSWTCILYPKLISLVRFVSSGFTSSRGVYVTFRSAAFAAALMAFLYIRRRRRLRIAEESRGRLIGIIQERDKKINQLLEQVSEMNQMLLKLHRNPSSHG